MVGKCDEHFYYTKKREDKYRFLSKNIASVSVSVAANRGKVEYFYDGNCDVEGTLVREVAVGEVISAYPDKIKAGYRLVRDTCPLAVGADSESNVIRVYYERVRETPPEGRNGKPRGNKPGGGPSKNPAMIATDWHATGMGDAQTLGDTIE